MNMELIGKALEVCPVKRRFIDMPGPEYYLTALDENGDPFGPAFEWIEEGGLARECQTVFAEDAMTAAWLARLIENKAEPLFPTRPASPCAFCASVWVNESTLVDCHGDTLLEALAAAVIAVKEAQ